MRLTKEGPLQTILANGNESREIICCDRIFFFFAGPTYLMFPYLRVDDCLSPEPAEPKHSSHQR